ncbi:CARDB domain-containing protein [Candidatus Altiarchaeota archaeon]
MEEHHIVNKGHALIIILTLVLITTIADAYPNGFPIESYREIIADAPWRINPEETSIPILIFINDAEVDQCISWNILIDPPQCKETEPHQFRLDDVDVYYQEELIHHKYYGKQIGSQETILIYPTAWYDLINVEKEGLPVNQEITLRVIISGIDLNCGSTCKFNEDVREEYELTLYIADESSALPSFDDYHCGDTHLHTIYTNNPAPGSYNTIFENLIEFRNPALDMGEIGAPVEATLLYGKLIGLDWTTLTDHSDDLTELGNDGNYDITLNEEKWASEYELCENSDQLTCILGEEITCSWSNLPLSGGSHLLAYDLAVPYLGHMFLGGKLQCNELMEDLLENNKVGFVAHPIDDTGIATPIAMQPWWDWKIPVNGFEVWNTMDSLDDEDNTKLEDGLHRYDKYLIKNPLDRKYIVAGSDAHGDLNKDLAKPMTCCYAPSNSKADILDSLANGRCILTSGPALMFNATIGNRSVGLGKTMQMMDGEELILRLDWRSTPEFGGIKYAQYIRGGMNYSEQDISNKLSGSFNFNTSSSWRYDNTFYRAWVRSSTGERAYTNPIWVEVRPVNVGSLHDVSFTVENDGGLASGSFNIRLWAGTPGSGSLLDEWNTNILPGQAMDFQYDWVPDATGSQLLTVEVDPDGSIIGDDPGDNQWTRSFLVTQESPAQEGWMNILLKEVNKIVLSPYDAYQQVTHPEYSIARYTGFTADDAFRTARIRLSATEEELNGIPWAFNEIKKWDVINGEWDALPTKYDPSEGYFESFTDSEGIFTVVGEARSDLSSELMVSRSDIVENGVVLLKASIDNAGVIPSEPFTAKVFAVRNHSILEELESKEFEGIQAGVTDSFVIEYDTAGKPGLTGFVLSADSGQEVLEYYEENNLDTVELDVTPETETFPGLVREFTSGNEVEVLGLGAGDVEVLGIGLPVNADILDAGLQIQAGDIVLDDPVSHVPERDFRTATMDSCEVEDGWSVRYWDALETSGYCVHGDCILLGAQADNGHSLWKTFTPPLDTQVTMDNGILAFWLYVSDASLITGDGQIEITSSGSWDSEELTFGRWLDRLDIQDGWNEVRIPLKDMGIRDVMPDLSAIDFFRIYWSGPGGLTVKVDDLHFESESYQGESFVKPYGTKTVRIYNDESVCKETILRPYPGEVEHISVTVRPETCFEHTKGANYEVREDGSVWMQVCRGGAGYPNPMFYGCGTNTYFDITYNLTGSRDPVEQVKNIRHFSNCKSYEDDTRVTHQKMENYTRDDRLFFMFDVTDYHTPELESLVLHLPIESIPTPGNSNNTIIIIPDMGCAQCSTQDKCNEIAKWSLKNYQDIELDVTEFISGTNTISFMVNGNDKYDPATVYYKHPYMEYKFKEELIHPEVFVGDERVWDAKLIYDDEAFNITGFEDVLMDHLDDGCGSSPCTVPLSFTAMLPGQLTASGLSISYAETIVHAQSTPESCDARGFCMECLDLPFADDYGCIWLEPAGECVRSDYASGDSQRAYTDCALITTTTTITSSTTTTLPPICAGGDPPQEGDWVVTGETGCDGRDIQVAGGLDVGSQSLELNGSGLDVVDEIVLDSYGVLLLDASDLVVE